MRICLFINIILFLIACFTALKAEIVIFEDANLENAVREALNITEGEITDEDMKGLFDLSANNLDISNLKGLKYAVNMLTIDISENQILDFSPLQGLSQLESINMSYNNCQDISSLKNLPALKVLFMEENQISQISPIEDFPLLTSLFADHNNISDITPLANLTDLTTLHLFKNKISNISSLSKLIQLTDLALGENQITDITPLSGLTKLELLDLYNNQVESLEALKNMTRLKHLFCFKNKIHDISPLAGLSQLELLELGECSVSDISPLASLDNMVHLDLFNNSVTDLSPLKNMTQLTHLYFNNNKIKDINPLANLTHLVILDLGVNNIRDISIIKNMTQLEKLFLQVNKISNLGALKNLTALNELWLENNELSDEDLPNLYDLDKITTHWAWGHSELFFDLRNNLGFTEEAIKALAAELPNISYEEILWDPIRPEFTLFPKITSLTDHSALIEWRLQTPVECDFRYSRDGENWRETDSESSDLKKHSVQLNDLAPETEYQYEILYSRNNGEDVSLGIYFFETLAERIEKKFQLMEKPKFLTRDDQSFTISYETDDPLIGLCRVIDVGKDTLSRVEEKSETKHVFHFDGLSPAWEYKIQIGALDTLSNLYFFSETEYSVKTHSQPDLTPPIILNGPNINPDTSFVLISFKTDEGARSLLTLFHNGETDAIDNAAGNDYRTNHQYILHGLIPGESYSFTIQLEDQAGNEFLWQGSPSPALRGLRELLKKQTDFNRAALSDGNEFSTTTESDTTAPIFTKPPRLLAAYDSLAIIRWETDEQSRSHVKVYNHENDLIYYSETDQFSYQQTAYALRLEPASEYTMEISCMDINENQSEEQGLKFITRKDGSPIKAEITRPVETFSTDDYTLIIWGTDFPGDSRAFTDLNPQLENQAVYYESEITDDHIVLLNGLDEKTRYFYQLSSYDFREDNIFETEKVDSFYTSTENPSQLNLEFTILPETLFTASTVMKLSWETNEISYYSIEYYPVNEPDNLKALSDENLSKTKSVLITSLTPSTEHNVNISCKTLTGREKTYSLKITTKDEDYLDLTPPDAPENVQVKNDSTGNQIIINWAASLSPDFDHYLIYRAENSSKDTLLLGENIELTRYQDDFFEAEGSFNYGIVAMDYFGNASPAAWSETITGINENDSMENEPFKLLPNSPNPFQDRVTIRALVKNQELYSLKIYDINGRVVYRGKKLLFPHVINEIELNTASWTSGIYIYQLKSQRHASKTRKMLLVK